MMGKTIVNLNYTSEINSLKSSISNAQIKTIVASRKFIEKLENKDISVLFKKTEEQLFKEFPDLVLFLSNQSGDSLREKLFLKLFKRKKCECGKETVFDSNKFELEKFSTQYSKISWWRMVIGFNDVVKYGIIIIILIIIMIIV